MFLEELGMVSGAEWGVRKPQLRYVIYPSVRHKAKKNKRKKGQIFQWPRSVYQYGVCVITEY